MITTLYRSIRLLLSAPPVSSILGVTLFSGNLLYRHLTYNDEIVTVKNKYVYTKVYGDFLIGSTQSFNFVSDNGKIYNIPNSIIEFQFDSEDKWAILQEGCTYKVSYWGIRHPFLGLYPRIYHIIQLK